MAKKKKQLSLGYKFAIVGAVLIIFQVLFIFIFSENRSQTARQAIEKALAKQNSLPNERKLQLRVQLALTDYMANHGNVPPDTLDALIPQYFDSIPVDPTTNQQIRYEVVDGRPFVGESPTQTASSKGDKKGGTEDILPLSDQEKEQALLIASLEESDATASSYVYDPSGKRDPFLPFNLAPETEDLTKTPLERYDIGQLKLTAVLAGIDNPTAMIENQAGIGFQAKKGTKIGTSGGEVVDILPDKILILETTTDFTGETKTRTIEMKLRTKDLEPKKR